MKICNQDPSHLDDIIRTIEGPKKLCLHLLLPIEFSSGYNEPSRVQSELPHYTRKDRKSVYKVTTPSAILLLMVFRRRACESSLCDGR